MTTIIRGTTLKPVASERLAAFFASRQELEGFLYIGYPIIGTVDGAFPIDALWLDPKSGITIFNLIENRDIADYQDAQDDSANKLESKLKTHRSLMQGRRLAIDLNVVTFAPALPPYTASDPAYQVLNEESLANWIKGLPTASSGAYNAALEVVQSISTIRKSKKRRAPVVAGSRGARLKALEDSIANLDSIQGQAVIETVEGVQRIRGLAGSGKTIILALKAAYLHAQHPEWKIAVTFNTRSLKGQLRRLINTFYIEQTSEEPDWNNLQILQAWGAPGSSERNGVYYTFCRETGAQFLDFSAAKSMFGTGREFEGACEVALRSAASIPQIYDVVLVDEAQDFSPVFLQICYSLLSSQKRLVYAYDELQNLNDKSLPSPEEIFGNKPDGTPLVSFSTSDPGKPKQDIILQVCYRNSRPLLATAHALGFGIYREPPLSTTTGLIQMFDQPSLWEEVGYKVADGHLQEGTEVTLARTTSSSPLFLENHSPLDDLIQFVQFATAEDQAAWLAQAIQTNIQTDELSPDDIVVINPDPITTRAAVGLPRTLLFNAGINSHLTGVDTSPDTFFDDDGKSVAFTGIFRAKGNEAGMVYIINAQDCASSFGNLARMRNRLFTAITRSKAWVRVLGVGRQMATLIQEFERVRNADFTLRFGYPTTSERAYLNIVNRDMTKEERSRVKSSNDNLAALLDDVNSGKVFLQDLLPEQVARLRAFFAGEPK